MAKINQKAESAMNWKKIESDLEQIHFWMLEDKLSTEFDFEEIEVCLYSEESADLGQFDFEVVKKILAQLDRYFAEGISHIQTVLRSNPELFQLTEEQMQRAREYAATNQYYKVPDNDYAKYAEVAPKDFPVNQPNLVFYPDGTWLMRFAEADFPTVNYGHGIALTFDANNTIIDFEILEEE